MPSGTVTVVMKAADADLVRAWQRAKEGPQQLQQELQKVQGKTTQLKGSTESLTTSMISGFGLSAAKILGVGSAVGAVATGIRLLRQEYDELIARQEAAAAFQSDVAPAQRAALRSLPSDLSAKELDAAAEKIQHETGAKIGSVYTALTGALSAKGDLPSTAAIEQVAAVMRIDPSMAPQDLRALAGAGLDLEKSFPGTTAEQATGFALAGQLTSRVEETGMYAKNVMPGIVQMSAYGASAREASSLHAALTQRSVDTEGARSTNALVRFADQITTATASVAELKDKTLPERLVYLRSNDRQAQQIRAGLLGSFDQDLVAAGYTGKGDLSGEAKQIVAMKELLTEGSKTVQLYESAYEATPELSQADRIYRRNLKEQEQLGIIRTKQTEESFRAGIERRLANEQTGQLGATEAGLKEFLTQMGQFGTARFLPGTMQRFYEIGKLEAMVSRERIDPRFAASKVLESRLQFVEKAREAEEAGGLQKAEELAGQMRALNELALKDVRRRGDEAQAAKILEAMERQNQILERIEKNTGNDKVSIKNPNEGARTANRGRARPAPIKGAGSP